MVDVSTYEFEPLAENIVKSEESFVNANVNECFDSKGTINSTRRIRILLDTKEEKDKLNKVMNEQWQY